MGDSRLTPWLLASSLLLATPAVTLASGQAVPRDGYPPAWGYPAPPDQRYPNRPYPDRDDRYPRGRWGSYGVGYDNGFDEGYRRGFDDGEDGDRFDPIGEKSFRKADKGYDRRYGPKGYYQNEYRQGFRAGYERGYRDGRYHRYDDRRGSRGWGGWRW
jgi:hypothetical protein